MLFGPGMEAGGEAEHWAQRRNLLTNVEFRGSVPREQILDFLEIEADLMVHPSLIETHGMVLIEAMACGVPVVGGRKSGAVAWTLDEGRSGFLCDVKNSRKLADSIIKAMKQPDDNQALAERAWRSVHKRFRLEEVAKANEDIITRLYQEII